MNYTDTAKNILENLGGPANVQSLVHCATRLRFNLKDESLANDAAIENSAGVVGLVKGGGQYQVIIGPDVANVYREFQKLGVSSDSSQTKNEAKGARGILNTVLDYIAGSFTPVLPVITAGGMIQVVLSLLVTFKLISETSDTYLIFAQVSQAAFYFIPMYLGYSVAKKFRIDPFLGMLLAGVLLIPQMGTLLTQEGGITLLGFKLQAITYSSSVLPIFLGVWAMSYLDRVADKFIPNSLKFVLKPLVMIMIAVPLTLIVLGPLGFTVGNYLAMFLEFLQANLGWAAVLVMGAFSPVLVMAGMHYALFPMLMTAFATNGYDMLVVPGMLAANMAQAGAATAVALKTKSSVMKQLASSSAITALMGVTEPAMYGVNLRLKKPFLAVMIGGAAGGLYAGISGLKAYALVSSLVALPSYLASTTNFINAIVTCALGYGVAFAAAYVIGFEDIVDADQQPVVTIDKSLVKEMNLASPVKGEIIDLMDVNDSAFSSLALGKGFAVIPSEGKVVSPVSGVISAIFPTKHAIGITTDEGIEILIHVGINTVQLGGKHFTNHVAMNEKITKGQLLIEFDLKAIQNDGYDTTTMVVITNTSQYLDVLAHRDEEKALTVVL